MEDYRVPTRHIDAARQKMEAARSALEKCQANEPLNIQKVRTLFMKLSDATKKYVAAVDEFIARGKPN